MLLEGVHKCSPVHVWSVAPNYDVASLSLQVSQGMDEDDILGKAQRVAHSFLGPIEISIQIESDEWESRIGAVDSHQIGLQSNFLDNKSHDLEPVNPGESDPIHYPILFFRVILGGRIDMFSATLHRQHVTIRLAISPIGD